MFERRDEHTTILKHLKRSRRYQSALEKTGLQLSSYHTKLKREDMIERLHVILSDLSSRSTKQKVDENRKPLRIPIVELTVFDKQVDSQALHSTAAPFVSIDQDRGKNEA